MRGTRELRNRLILLAGAALLPSFAASASYAAEPAARAVEIDEIVVTSRNREEKLQDVPLAITAVTSATLQEAGIRNIRDLAYLVPGLTINSSGAEFDIRPTIRGVISLGGGTGVTIFQDGVSSGVATTNLSLLDVERVEVVKGPVAAIYGGGAYAGAINYVSKTPGDTLTAIAQARLGNGGTRDLNGYISGPVIPDFLSLGLAGSWNKFGGIYKDKVNGNKAGGFEKKDVRLTLHATPIDNLDVTGGLYYGKDFFDVTPEVFALNNCGPLSTNAVSRGEFTQYCGELQFLPLQVATLNPKAGVKGNSRENWFGNLRAVYATKYVDFTYMGSWAKTKQDRFNDFTGRRDGIPFQLNPGPGNINLLQYFGSGGRGESYSHEFRIANKQDQRLRILGGFYYSKTKPSTTVSTQIGLDGSRLPAGQTIVGTGLTYLTANGEPNQNAITINENLGGFSQAFFGTADFDILPNLTLSGEYRTSIGKSTGRTQRSTSRPGVLYPLGAATVVKQPKQEPYRVGLKWQAVPSVMLYASYGQGVKGGGRNNTATLVSEQTFGPEVNKTYELGAKTSFLENRLQINAAVFSIKTDGLQLNGPSDDVTNASLLVKNIGGATSKGFELEGTFRPTNWLRLNAGVAYADPKFATNTLDFSNGLLCLQTPTACSADRVVTVQRGATTLRALRLDGMQLPRTSKLSVTLGGEVRGELANEIEWFARADFRYESKTYPVQTEFAYLSSKTNVNLNVGVSKDRYRASIFVNNLTDNHTPENVTNLIRLNDFNGNMTGYLPLPRTYGVQLEYRY